MPTIAEVRQKFPQYNDLSDDQLAGALHKKYYSDMPVEQFQEKIGMKPSPSPIPGSENLDPAQIPPRNPPMSFSEGAAGVAGNMLNAIPIVGPALVGAGNRITAAKHSLMEGKPYAQALEEAQTQGENFNREHPAIANSAAAAGGIGSMLVGGGTGAGAKALGIVGKNLGTRTLAGGATGTAIGGADAYARGNDPVVGAAVGGVTGLAAPAAGQVVGAGVRSVMGRGAPRVATIDDMRTVKNQAYQTVDQLGARYTPRAYSTLVGNIQNSLARDRISPMRHPLATSMVDDLNKAQATWAIPNSPTLTELDQLRQVIRRDVVNAGDNAEAHFGDLMLDGIDNFIDSATPAQMAGGGNPRAASNAIREARRANTQLRKAEMIDDALTRAARRAASTGSGGNVENTIRQNIRAILDNPKRVRAFSPDERKIMNQIVAPASRLQDITRLVGKLSPSGNGLMAALSLGATAVNPMMAIPAGAGIIAKKMSEGMTQGRVNKLQQLVNNGGIAGAQPLTGTPDAARRAVQAITMGGPMSLYPPFFADSSARVPR